MASVGLKGLLTVQSLEFEHFLEAAPKFLI